MKTTETETMKELYEARRKIGEEIKSLSPRETAEYFKRVSEKFEEESGIKLLKLQKI